MNQYPPELDSDSNLSKFDSINPPMIY